MQISLAAVRINGRYTQKKLAKELRVDPSTVISWEKGKTSPKSDQLKKISQLCNVSIDDIFLPETLLKEENKNEVITHANENNTESSRRD